MTMADLRTAAGEAIERVREALGLPVGSDVASLVTAIEALKAERDRLRTEVKHLGARVREWEAVNADLAARCDSGDIPIRLGERYSLAVLREIDRLRRENADLRAQLAEARADLAKLWDATGIPSDADMHLEDVADTIRRMAHDDRAIRRLLRDHGVSVGGDDPLPAIVAETVRRSGAELVELRDRHEQVCEELAEAREALVAAQTEGDEAWDRLSNLVDELAGALEMDGTPDDHEIIREARAFGQLRVELAALRAEREWLADRARQMGIADVIIATYGPAHAISAEVGRLRTERDALRAEVERAREIAHSYRHEIGAAQVFDVLEAALGSTPDGSTT